MSDSITPSHGEMFELAAKSGLEKVDRLVRGDRVDLGAHQSAVDDQIGLGHHRLLDRGILVPGQPYSGGKHWPMRHPTELTDLHARVFGDVG